MPFAWLHCFIGACVWVCIVVGVCHVWYGAIVSLGVLYLFLWSA